MREQTTHQGLSRQLRAFQKVFKLKWRCTEEETWNKPDRKELRGPGGAYLRFEHLGNMLEETLGRRFVMGIKVARVNALRSLEDYQMTLDRIVMAG
jgi:hypothetical protein